MRRGFADLFKGTAEMNQVMQRIGWIAVHHHAVKDALDYLLWQLRCFEIAGRRSSKDRAPEDLQRLFRKERDEATRRDTTSQLEAVRTSLQGKRLATALKSDAPGASLLDDWRKLSRRVDELTQERNKAIHSAMWWSAGGLVRTRGGFLDGKPEKMELADYDRLSSALGGMLTSLGEFIAKLDELLGFPTQDKVRWFSTTVTLPPR